MRRQVGQTVYGVSVDVTVSQIVRVHREPLSGSNVLLQLPFVSYIVLS